MIVLEAIRKTTGLDLRLAQRIFTQTSRFTQSFPLRELVIPYQVTVSGTTAGQIRLDSCKRQQPEYPSQAAAGIHARSRRPGACKRRADEVRRPFRARRCTRR